MTERLSCSHGHEWQAPVTAPSGDASSTCPVCGEPAELGSTYVLPNRPASDATVAGPDRAFHEVEAQKQGWTIGVYEILGELGRGAMGVVYKARHTKLDRVVALKMVRAGEHANALELARFSTEALAVAHLHHPNIVQLYEAGEHEGLPYFSLEYIDGGSLSAKLSGSPVAPLEAARLVETVARAVHAAHQRGVVHRDLKPANILLSRKDDAPATAGLDAFDPKIADFGLAKRLDADPGHTQAGSLIGTPSYMAPEQAQSRPGEIGPPVDIYALGAILYELLTGRPPFRAATPLETATQVVSEEPLPPTRLAPRTPRDLQTICLKCLSKDPRKRYPSADAVADDLHRFLADEPIEARPVPFWERAWKWMKRRPASAALIAFCLCVTGGIVADVVQWGAQLRAHNAELQVANNREREARLREAANYQRARQAVQDLLTEVGRKELANVPHMDLVRKSLLEKALHYRQDFTQENSADPAVRLESGQASYDVGDVYHMLGRANEAEACYRQAIAIFDELAERIPGAAEYRWEAALSRRRLGNLLEETGHRDGAEQTLQQAQQLLQDLCTQVPTDLRYREERAHVQSNLALVFAETNRPADAEKAFHQAMDILTQLRNEMPEVPDYREQLASCQLNFGVVLKQVGRPEEAGAAYRAAIDLLKGLEDQFPDNREYREREALACNNLGNLLSRLGHAKESEQMYDAALKLRRKLVADFPQIPDYRHGLALTCESVGQSAWVKGQHAQAEKLLQEARTIKEQLVNEFPSVTDYRSSLGLSLLTQGRMLQDQGKWAESVTRFEASIARQREALQPDSRNPQYRGFLSDTYWFLADSQIHLGDYAAAQKTIATLVAMMPNDSENCYNAACLESHEILALQKDQKLSAAQKQTLSQDAAKRGMELLRTALAHGFNDDARLRSDHELDGLRSLDEFKKLLAARPAK